METSPAGRYRQLTDGQHKVLTFLAASETPYLSVEDNGEGNLPKDVENIAEIDQLVDFGYLLVAHPEAFPEHIKEQMTNAKARGCKLHVYVVMPVVNKMFKPILTERPN